MEASIKVEHTRMQQLQYRGDHMSHRSLVLVYLVCFGIIVASVWLVADMDSATDALAASNERACFLWFDYDWPTRSITKLANSMIFVETSSTNWLD